MEVECKVILASEADVDKLMAIVGQQPPVARELQDNHFLDSNNGALESHACVLRVRVLPEKKESEITLKEDSHTEHGTTLRWSTSARFPFDFATRVLDAPTTLLTDKNNIAVILKSKYNISELHYVGGFRTERRTYPHPASEVQQCGLLLKIDKVDFPFGTQYEVEVAGSIVPIGDVLEELCAKLDSVGIKYTKSEESKYETFLKGVKRTMMSGDLRATMQKN